jgi:hypothetical protein
MIKEILRGFGSAVAGMFFLFAVVIAVMTPILLAIKVLKVLFPVLLP